MTNQTISVIIPVYNVKSYLDKCLESVTNQTYKNLEIICVDDGSIDGSSELLDEWAEKDNRIKAIHKENGGVSSARNVGLKAATGEYIAFVDGDDYLDNDAYRYIISKSDPNADVIVFGFKTFFYSEKLKCKRTDISSGIDMVLSKDKLFTDYNIYGKYLYNSVWNKLFRKRIIQKCEFDESMKLAEDLYFCLDAYRYANEFQFINLPVYNYVFIMKPKRYVEYTDDAFSFAFQRNIDLTEKLISLGRNREEAETVLKTDIIRTGYAHLRELITYSKLTNASKYIKLCISNDSLLNSIDNRDKRLDNIQIRVVAICCKFQSVFFTYTVFKIISLFRNL